MTRTRGSRSNSFITQRYSTFIRWVHELPRPGRLSRTMPTRSLISVSITCSSIVGPLFELVVAALERLRCAALRALAQEVEFVVLEAQIGAQRMAEVAANELLCAAEAVERHLVHRLAGDECIARVPRNAARPVLDGRLEVGDRHRAIDQAHPLGIAPAEVVAEQKKLARLFRAVHQDLRIEVPRVPGEAEPLLGMAERRIVGGDREVDELYQVQPGAGAMTVDLRDDRL